MADFYLDNDVPVTVASYLESLGHSVVTAKGLNLTRASDAQHLLEATTLKRYLVTHNGRDFRLLHHAWILWPAAWAVDPPRHATVLVLHQQPAAAATAGVPIAQLHAQRLHSFTERAASSTAGGGEVYTFKEDRGWDLDLPKAPE